VRRTRRGRLVAVALVCVLAAACGGGDDDDDGPVAPDPSRDRDVAEAASLRLLDVGDTWQQIDFEALGAPPTMETLSECLGDVPTPTAEVVRGYRFGAGINVVAVSEVQLLPDVAAAQAAIAPTVEAPFVPCVVEKVKSILSASIGEGLSVGEVTGTVDNVAPPGASGVGVDMHARVQSATGERPLYPAVGFVQKGRALAIVTLLSNNSSVADRRRSLSSAVAGRLPTE
jgi:hypothetical protein